MSHFVLGITLIWIWIWHVFPSLFHLDVGKGRSSTKHPIHGLPSCCRPCDSEMGAGKPGACRGGPNEVALGRVGGCGRRWVGPRVGGASGGFGVSKKRQATLGRERYL